VVLSEIDRSLLERCLQRKPRAWQDFVDRFMGLLIHVINHTAQARSIRLSPEDRDDLCAEVFLRLMEDDFAILRHFRGQSSLATYLAVVARRIVVRQLMSRKPSPLAPSESGNPEGALASSSLQAPAEERIANRELVERLLDRLGDGESQVVRMYHLEGRSYEEISHLLGIPVNSVGPILSRARAKMRQAGLQPGS